MSPESPSKAPHEARIRSAANVPEGWEAQETVNQYRLHEPGSGGGSKTKWDRLLEEYGDAPFSFLLQKVEDSTSALDVVTPPAGERVASNGVRIRVLGGDAVGSTVEVHFADSEDQKDEE